MLKVSATITKILKQKNADILSGSEAMNKLLLDLHRQVVRDLGEAALGSWDAYQLKQLLDAIERRLADYSLVAKKEMGGRISAMFDLGVTSVSAPLAVGGIWSGFNIPQSLVSVLQDFSFLKIDGYTGAAWDKIRSELTLGAIGGKTPQQVADALGPLLPGGKVAGNKIFPSIAQRAEFVTKTELGRTFQEAADRRMKEAAKYVDGLEKVWHHGHPKVARLTHLNADNVAVAQNKAFPVRDKNGYQLMYPHDPNADFSEVAGCQCSHTVWVAKWGARDKAA